MSDVDLGSPARCMHAEFKLGSTDVAEADLFYEEADQTNGGSWTSKTATLKLTKELNGQHVDIIVKAPAAPVAVVTASPGVPAETAATDVANSSSISDEHMHFRNNEMHPFLMCGALELSYSRLHACYLLPKRVQAL
ncbi:hypothetical protein MRX96_054834 [Rhipicephalus microplus]